LIKPDGLNWSRDKDEIRLVYHPCHMAEDPKPKPQPNIYKLYLTSEKKKT